MNKDSIIAIWQSQQYSETDITKAFNICHRDLRILLQRHDIAVPDTIPHSMKLEIYRDMSEDPVHKIAKDYGVGPATIIRYRKSVPVLTTEDDSTVINGSIKDYHEAGYSNKEIMEVLGVSYYTIRKALAEPRKELTAELIAKIQEDLNNGMFQADIAAKYSVSPATVSKYNPNKKPKPRGTGLDDDQWAQLKASLGLYSISEVSRMYKVSRPYIYARLNKEKVS